MSETRLQPVHPEYYGLQSKAKYKLAWALKTGKIINPGKCSMCGSNVKVSGHHNDYNKPLEIEWLCASCHIGIRHGIHNYSREKIERNRKIYTAYKSNPDTDYALLGRAFGLTRQAVRTIIIRMTKKEGEKQESRSISTVTKSESK